MDARALERLAREWRRAMARRRHREAETALCDPDDAHRRRLIELTRGHPRWRTAYAEPLAELQALAEHEGCQGAASGAAHAVLALDCEMVETAADDMALARVSAVDASGRKVLDQIVLPERDPSFIVDCRTAVTGLSKADLVRDGVSVETARLRFARCCGPDTLLIGHALDHDLLALRFRHDIVVDTSHLYPVHLAPPEALHSLDFLTQRVLRREMNRDARGGVHDSLEDSINALDLAKFALLALRHAPPPPPPPPEAAETATPPALTMPPLPPRERRHRQRGNAVGFAGELQGRQVFAGRSLARGSATDARARAVYAMDLPPAHEQEQTTAPAPTPAAASAPARAARSQDASAAGLGSRLLPAASGRASDRILVAGGTARRSTLYQQHVRAKAAASRERAGASKLAKLRAKSRKLGPR